MIFKEELDYLLEFKNSVIIFFELLDFLSFSLANLNYNKEGSNSGWYKVAWAFLKLVGKNDHLNIEQKLRLQLYKPHKISKLSLQKSANQCPIHDWWLTGKFIKYPSTLYVSIKRVKSSLVEEYKNSDILLNKQEKDIDKTSNYDINDIQNTETTSDVYGERVLRQKNFPVSCKIPNKIHKQFKSGKLGCMLVKFSNNGLILACALADSEKNFIVLYEMTNYKEYCKFYGHKGLIYDMCWSAEDKFLISASADCTVYLWNVYSKSYHPRQMLPHPCFTYCAQIDTSRSEIITGCYDKVVRVWRSFDNNIDSNYELIQELDTHEGFITSICFGKDENIFYSSDSVGVIIEWLHNKYEWILQRTFKFKELEKTVISNIILQPNSNKMIAFCRDSVHRLIDLSVGCIMQWYRGALNYRVQMSGCITPCGTLVFSPSEDGSICMWNTDTGILQATFNPYITEQNKNIVTHCVDFNCVDDLVAISHYGSPLPILLCSFDKTRTGGDIKLKNCTESFDNSSRIRKCNLSKEIHSDIPKNEEQNVQLDDIIYKIEEVLMSARNLEEE